MDASEKYKSSLIRGLIKDDAGILDKVRATEVEIQKIIDNVHNSDELNITASEIQGINRLVKKVNIDITSDLPNMDTGENIPPMSSALAVYESFLDKVKYKFLSEEDRKSLKKVLSELAALKTALENKHAKMEEEEAK